MKKKIIIAGAGASGLTCSIYLARAGHEVHVFSDEENSISCLAEAPMIMNYPGFPDGISGFDLIELFIKQAKYNGVEFHMEGIAEVKKGMAYDTSGNAHSFDEFVMATGVKPRTYHCDGIQNIPVHTCAICDGSLYNINDTVAIVGGGDTAVNSALYLSDLVKRVCLIVRHGIRATNMSSFADLMLRGNVSILSNTVISSISAPDSEGYCQFKDMEGNVLPYAFKALFSCIGYDANIIPIESGCRFWKCGDCTEKHHQISVAVGSGAKTALDIIGMK